MRRIRNSSLLIGLAAALLVYIFVRVTWVSDPGNPIINVRGHHPHKKDEMLRVHSKDFSTNSDVDEKLNQGGLNQHDETAGHRVDLGQRKEEKRDNIKMESEEEDEEDVNVGLKGWNFLWKRGNSGEKESEINNECKKNRALRRFKSMTKGLGRKFDVAIPVLINSSNLHFPQSEEFRLPFGIKDTEDKFMDALNLFTNTELPIEVTNASCSRCVIVGSGGIVKDKNLGSAIDKYDVVIRVNGGPVYGYESDVGTRTTLRVTHPEGAPVKLDDYDPSALIVLVVFKAADIEWAKRVAVSDVADLSDIPGGFWKGPAKSVPNKPDQFRILSPALVKETAFEHVRFPSFDGKMFKNVPTTGTIAIVMAIRMCDTVDVAGFGFDLRDPKALLHYYGNTRMSAVRNLKTHDIMLEKEFLRDLVQHSVITDLTGGLAWI